MPTRITENPFYVLELRPEASAAEVERQGQKLIAMLEVGFSAAGSYPTPLGGMPRDADLVRRSLDALRDPGRRAVHEVWAALDPSVERHLEHPEPETTDLPSWHSARRAFGWGRS